MDCVTNLEKVLSILMIFFKFWFMFYIVISGVQDSLRYVFIFKKNNVFFSMWFFFGYVKLCIKDHDISKTFQR